MTGTFLYYERAVDRTMLVVISAIAPEQANPTNTTMKIVKKFLNYAASHQYEIVTHHPSDMTLACHSYALYLSKTKAISRVGGNFFLSENDKTLRKNGAVLNIYQIIKVVMALSAEAEIGAMHLNAHEPVQKIIPIVEMGHPQPRTPMQNNNLAAYLAVTNNIQPIITKAMDMNFH